MVNSVMVWSLIFFVKHICYAKIGYIFQKCNTPWLFCNHLLGHFATRF